MFALNITVLNPPIVQKVIVLPNPTIFHPQKIAKTDRITVFGEVDIELNLEDRVVRDLDLEKIDNNTITMYIDPVDNWTEYYNEDHKNLNFSWKIKELTADVMSIKMDFEEPTNISPFIRYDKLVVHIPDLSKLFLPKQLFLPSQLNRDFGPSGRRL